MLSNESIFNMKSTPKWFILALTFNMIAPKAYALCPPGYEAFGKSCRSIAEMCQIDSKAPTEKVTGKPQVDCPLGEYDGTRCIYEDFIVPDVFCPPGFHQRLLTLLPNLATGGWYKPSPQELAELKPSYLVKRGIREYICEKNIVYNAVPSCFGDNVYMWNESCRYIEHRYPKPVCGPGFTYFDRLGLCIEDEPICPKGLELRFVADKKLLKYLQQSNNYLNKYNDANRNGVADLDYPLDAICVSIPETYIVQSGKKSGQNLTAAAGDIKKEAPCDGVYDQKYNVCMPIGQAQPKIVVEVERMALEPMHECLSRGAIYDPYVGKCVREFTTNANWNCLEGDLLDVKWNRGPQCSRILQVPAETICPKGAELVSDVIPNSIALRHDWKNKWEPGIPRPWCKILRSTPAIVTCKKKEAIPVDGNVCVIVKDDKFHAKCSKDEVPPLDCKKSDYCNNDPYSTLAIKYH